MDMIRDDSSNIPGKKCGGSAPFFSVCTEVTNREKTIRKTIEAIARQRYRNFEYIIINNQSSDNSDQIIKQALSEVPFNDIAITYVTTERKLSDIESWNAPLAYARGKYIVVCEGDDWFASDHLEIAARVLMGNTNIGLYVAGRGDLSEKINHEKYNGMQNATPGNVLLERLVNFTFAPPPSEAIFLRRGNSGPFLYNPEKYIYAAEYGLYYEILRQGFDGFLNLSIGTVFRGQSSYMRRFFHMRDAYTVLAQWRSEYHSDSKYKEMRIKLLRRSIAILGAQIAGASVEYVLFAHVIKEAVAMRTWMPLWVLPKCVIVCIRQRLGVLRACRYHK